MTRYLFNRTHPANPGENQGDKRSHHPRNRFFFAEQVTSAQKVLTNFH
jgi:hypothetical protein